MPDAQPPRRRERLLEQLRSFMDEHVTPSEPRWHEELAENRRAGAPFTPLTVVEELKALARQQDLWNLWWPWRHGGPLATSEYALVSEAMGAVPWAAEVFNCSAPDTGNMETLLLYGSPEQQQRWLSPLADGSIRSAFAMTEPDVGCSDATNVRTRVEREGDQYVVDGRKWWTSGAMDPRCTFFIVLGRSTADGPRHAQHTMILVPRETPGVTIVRPLTVFGYDGAPHGHAEVRFDRVRVPAENVVLGEGRGFEIAQGRLGPGRVHHCMRLIGVAERALELMCRRALDRVTFGRALATRSVTRERIAESRIMIDAARELTLKTARIIDEQGAKAARAEIAMIKVQVPNVACQVLDWAIQLHGGAGVCDDLPLAQLYAEARALRLADGPDEVHRDQLARLELARHAPAEERP